jgi:hypothetical protein
MELFYGKANCVSCQSGACDTLEEVVRHHIDPEGSLRNYNRANFVAPHGDDLDEIAKANELKMNRRIKDAIFAISWHS